MNSECKQRDADVIVIGAGAAGLFCAAQLGQGGKRVIVLDNGKKIGRKILMSGGGHCNFTNLDVHASHYLSQNPHFVKSALARFTQWDFIGLVAEYQIAYHEKELGQLFCDEDAAEIVRLLRGECEKGTVAIRLRQQITAVEKTENSFTVSTNGERLSATQVVVATGGLSMPALGASPFGYQIAEQFGLNIVAPRAALVPFTFRESDKPLSQLSGVSLPVRVKSQSGQAFQNALLFTHRGLSGPAMLQISSYWQPNEALSIDLLPHHDWQTLCLDARQTQPKQQVKTLLSRYLPKKWVEFALAQGVLPDKTLADLSAQEMANIADRLHRWQFFPNGTEGYRTAEVTQGGVDTRQISSKTMEASTTRGLYFIGEVLDVTGQLGGYNFQWAWSSAYACAQGILTAAETAS